MIYTSLFYGIDSQHTHGLDAVSRHTHVVVHYINYVSTTPVLVYTHVLLRVSVLLSATV